MAIVCCNLGIGAANLGIGAVYLDIHKPIFGIAWTFVGLGWFCIAALNWRTHRTLKRIRALVAEVRVALELRKAAGMVYDPSIDQAIWNDALIDALAAYDKVTGGK